MPGTTVQQIGSPLPHCIVSSDYLPSKRVSNKKSLSDVKVQVITVSGPRSTCRSFQVEAASKKNVFVTGVILFSGKICSLQLISL